MKGSERSPARRERGGAATGDAGGQAFLIPQSSHTTAPIATTARPASFNADRMRVTSAGLNPDEISAVLNAEFGFMLPTGRPSMLACLMWGEGVERSSPSA